MENGFTDEATELKRWQDDQMNLVDMHLGVILQYSPSPMVMDCI